MIDLPEALPKVTLSSLHIPVDAEKKFGDGDPQA